MINEKVSQSSSNENLNSKPFVDKLISFKGILKILLFFTLQLGVLMFQINHLFSVVYPGYSYVNFWFFNMSMFSEVIINYAVFGMILLLIFAFYLGKELKMRRKEKYIMFVFKGFLALVIFLLLNATFIYRYTSAFYLAKTGNPSVFEPIFYFTSDSILILFFLWFFIILFYVLVKTSLFFVHLFTGKGSKNKNVYFMNQQGYVNQPMPQPNYNQRSVQSPSNTSTSVINALPNAQNNIKNTVTSNNGDYLSKEQIRQIQSEKFADYKAEQKKAQMNYPKTEEIGEKSSVQEEIKAKTPMQIITFLNNHLFNKSIPEQGIIFFTISQFFWLIMLTLDIFSNTNGFSNFSYYYYSISSVIGIYAILEFLFYLFESLVYYDILKHHFKLPSSTVNKHIIVFLGIGTGLILTSLTLASYFQNPGSSILFFIVLKFLVLLLIPAFYFGYKSQNQTNSDSLVKINPVFTFLYNRSMNELRSNEKSAEIIKKFLQTHKEDIKKSLLDATPVNFKDNIKSVIINDYDRLETLLSYNNISVKSKISVIDYSMEVFSTFLINLEVNLQDIYTEHLLKSSEENLHKPISNEFIESKFTKLFSQWESLDWSS